MNTFRLQSDSSMEFFILSGVEGLSDWSHPVAGLVEASRACATGKAEQKP